jgi:hypothetical protein
VLPNPLEEVVGADITKVVGALITVTPLSVALTNTVTVPAEFPAVKVTVDPDVGERLPNVFVTDQEYVVPAGHVPPVQVGVATRTRVSPWFMLVEEGLTVTATDESLGVVVPPLMVTTAEADTVMPLSVALTQRATFPEVVPAVNTTAAVLSTLIDPMLLTVRVHR